MPVTFRTTADNYDQASHRAWGRYPQAMAVVIQYRYNGWYKCIVYR